jgi:hypothetical protein
MNSGVSVCGVSGRAGSWWLAKWVGRLQRSRRGVTRGVNAGGLRRERKQQCEVGLQSIGGSTPKANGRRCQSKSQVQLLSVCGTSWWVCVQVHHKGLSRVVSTRSKKGGKSADVVFCVVGGLTLVVEPVVKG